MTEVLERYRHVASLGAPRTAEEYIARLQANPGFYRQLVGRLPAQLPTVVDTDDVMQEAACAIMRAFQTHQSWRGPIESWVQLTVRNHIRDWLRRHHPLTRHHRKQLLEIFGAMSGLEQRLGRHPSDEEVILSLGWTPSRYREALDGARASYILSLSEFGITVADGETPFDTVWSDDCEARLSRAMRTLPLADRTLLTSYYVEDISLRQIAQSTGRSETAVKKEHKRALARLRVAMGVSDSGKPAARGVGLLQRARTAMDSVRRVVQCVAEIFSRVLAKHGGLNSSPCPDSGVHYTFRRSRILLSCTLQAMSTLGLAQCEEPPRATRSDGREKSSVDCGNPQPAA